MILVTTSRHPNPRLRSFVKDLTCALPNAIHINRGKLNLDELAAEAYRRQCDIIVIVCRGQHGNPGRIVFIHIYKDHYEFYPLIIQIQGIKLIREMPDAKIRKINNEVLGYFDSSEEVENFAQSLSEALGLPLVELNSIEEIKGMADAALIVEYTKNRDVPFVLKFLSSKDFSMIGPLIRVKKVVYRCPTIE